MALSTTGDFAGYGLNPSFADDLPLDFLGAEIGTQISTTFQLENLLGDMELGISAFDIDASEEVKLYINGQSVDLPTGLVVPNQSSTDTLILDRDGLVEGENTLTFEFASNLDGKTSGYRIDNLCVSLLNSEDTGASKSNAEIEHESHDIDDPLMGEHMALLDLLPHDRATHIAISSGSWFDPNTWQDGAIPENGAKVLIPAGDRVIYDGESDARLDILRIDGTLSFKSDRNTLLIADTVISNSHSTLEIGTEENPIQGNKTARILIHNDKGAIDPASDPQRLGRGVVTHGKVRIHGADKSDFLPLQDEARAGDDRIVLSRSPVGWRVGDRLVLGGTAHNPQGSDEDNSRFQDEVLTITAIEGNTIRFTNNDIASGDNTVLRFNHTRPEGFAEYDLKLYVANTTRNVVFATENAEEVPTQQRGHVMFMHNPDVVVEHAGFYDLGRSDKSTLVDDPGTQVDGSQGGGTNPRGRYSVHFHRTGADDINSTPSFATGNAVVGSPGWGLVHHDSHAHLRDNVVFDVAGAAIAAEAGNEIGLWENNLTIKTPGIEIPLVQQEDFFSKFDLGFQGDGYWVQGAAQVEMRDNIAISVGGNAAMIFSGADFSNPVRDAEEVAIANLPEELQSLTGASAGPEELETIDVSNVPLRQLSGFEAYNVDVGISFWQHMRNDDGQLGFNAPSAEQAHDARSLVEDFRLWGVYGDGIFTQYSTQVDFVDGLIVGDPQNPIAAQIGANGVEGRGHGISGNIPTQDLSFVNLHIEGFEEGVRLPVEGGGNSSRSNYEGVPFLGSRLEKSYLANNTYNLAKDSLHRGHSPEAFSDYFEIIDTTFAISDPQNEAPSARFDAENIGGENVVLFDASSSYDPDPPEALDLLGNAIASYGWDFNNNGQIDDFGRFVNHAFPVPGEYQIALTVWDAHGQTTTSVQTISVEPTVYPNLFVNGDFSQPNLVNSAAIESTHADTGWLGSRVALRESGVVAFSQSDRFNLGRVGLAQTWLDNSVYRGSQTLQLHLKNTEGSDEENQIIVELWGIDGEFSSRFSGEPSAVGAIPMTTTQLLSDTVSGDLDSTLQWEVDLDEGYQFLFFKIYAKNFDPDSGDSITVDNFFLGTD